MLLRFLLTLVLLSSTLFICANDHEKLYYARQVNNSGEEFATYLEKAGVTSDILYIFHFQPNSCPRCEIAINPLIHLLKDRAKGAQVLMVASYPFRNAAIRYVTLQNYKIDLLAIDHDNRLTSFIKPNALTVPFLYKVNAKSGTVLHAVPLLGIHVTDALADEINTDQTAIQTTEATQASLKEEKLNSIDKESVKLELIGQFQQHPKFPSSIPNDIIWTQEQGYLFVLDNLANAAYRYNLETSLLERVIGPTLEEYNLNIDTNISRETVQVLLNRGSAKVINLSFLAIDDSSFTLTSSLPKLILLDEEGNIGNSNRITFLKKDFDGNTLRRQSIEARLSHDLTLAHQYSVVLENTIAIPVIKGWPATGSQSFDQVEEPDNPFSDSFYKNAPLLALFDRSTNDFMGYIGTIPKLTQATRSGYYFCLPTATQHGDYIYLTDGYSGEIQVYHVTDSGWELKDSLNILFPSFKFSVDTQQLLLTSPNERLSFEVTPDPLDYYDELNQKLYTHRVKNIAIANGWLYALLYKGDQFFYTKVNLATKSRTPLAELPMEVENMRALQFKLMQDQLIGLFGNDQHLALYQIAL